MEFLKTISNYIRTHVFDLIVIFVLLLFIRSLTLLVGLLFIDVQDSWVLIISFIATVISLLQLYTLFMAKKFAWMVSVLQIGMIYFTSTGTFGYIAEVIVMPFIQDRTIYAYTVSSLLLISEALKTFWLFFVVRVTPD